MPGNEKGYYQNDKLDLAIRLLPKTGQLTYVQKMNLFASGTSDDFENSIGGNGFKKKTGNIDGEKQEFYYNDMYV
jgi:hypothetical protein